MSRLNVMGARISECILKGCTFEDENIFTGGFASGAAALSAERATVKGTYTSGVLAVAVPSITDPDIASVAVDVSAMAFVPAVGDRVQAIPQEALPTNCRLQNAYVSATDTVTVVFGSEGGNVTGANKNFKFVFDDLT